MELNIPASGLRHLAFERRTARGVSAGAHTLLRAEAPLGREKSSQRLSCCFWEIFYVLCAVLFPWLVLALR